MSEIEAIKERWHRNKVSHSDMVWMFERIEELEGQLQWRVDLHDDACKGNGKLRIRIEKLKAELKEVGEENRDPRMGL